jgi:hypothetical protein
MLTLSILACQRSSKPSPGSAVAVPGSASTEEGHALPSKARTDAMPLNKSPVPPQQQAEMQPNRTAQAPSATPAAISLSKAQQAQPLAGGTGGPRSLSSAGTLMALGREKRALPEDFKIGPLGDDKGAKADEDGAVSIALSFLSGLVAGVIDRKLLTPDSEQRLSDTLTYGLRQGYDPSSFRIGTPKAQDDGEITANVRLFGAEGTSEGEIYMTRAGKQWLVSDLQLTLAQLAVKRTTSKEKYFPSAYRWLLEN